MYRVMNVLSNASDSKTELQNFLIEKMGFEVSKVVLYISKSKVSMNLSAGDWTKGLGPSSLFYIQKSSYSLMENKYLYSST